VEKTEVMEKYTKKPGTMYRGQTGQHISTRTSEHFTDTRLQNQWSVVDKNSTKTKCSVKLNTTEALTNIHTYCPCIISKAIRVVKHPQNLNPSAQGI
jgi:hypothetical protein